MAISEKPWSGAASEWPDTGEGRTANFCRSCLLNENSGDVAHWTQDACHLPVYTPDGALSRAAVHNAAARLSQTKTSPANRKAAARKLLRLYGELKEPPPESVRRIAGQ